MGRLSDHATAMDIIAQLHASLLLCSFLRMAAGELTKRAALWTVCVCGSVPVSECMCVFVHVSKPHLYVCVCGSGLFLLESHCLCLVCVNASMFVSMHMLRALVCGVWGCVCMHVEWHLAKCGSERRNIWLIIEVPWKKYDHESVLGLRAQLQTGGRSTRRHAQPALRLPYHPEGWLQRSKWYSTKMAEENTAHSRRAILMTKSIGRSALISIKKRVSGWM